MAKYKKRADGRYYTTIQTNEINPDTGELHIAKLNGRVCGAKRPHSVSEQPIYTMSR